LLIADHWFYLLADSIKCKSLNRKQSAIGNQQSAISNQQSAIGNQQSAIGNQQSTISNHLTLPHNCNIVLKPRSTSN